jgi:hypothetical protein
MIIDHVTRQDIRKSGPKVRRDEAAEQKPA